MKKPTSRAGLIVGVLWLACLLSLVIAMIAGGVVAQQRYGGIGPAYGTLSDVIWFPITQTAYVPIGQTAQAEFELSSTAGAPASQTADVFLRQTSTAGVVPSMTWQVLYEQTATAGYYPALTEQAHWDATSTAGVPATANAYAIETQNAP